MIRKDRIHLKNGIKTHIRVVEGYRDSDGKIKQRTIKTFGYLEDQPNQSVFLKEVAAFDKEFFLSKKAKKDSFTTFFYEDSFNIPYNYGYRFLETIYDSLHIKSFFNQTNFKCDYPLNDIFKYLVLQRILNPDSKRATVQLKDSFYNFHTHFELHHVYRALDKINDVKVNLQKHLNEQIVSLIGRDNTYAFYDVTNYYTEIDFPNDSEDLRQRGVSKERRVEPIIQLGLFIDSNGLPISMSLFKGNTADSKTLQPIMEEIKVNYHLKRLVVVADKGLNTSSNINYIVNNDDGYVVSQILRGKKGKRYHEELFNEDSYIYNQNRTFKHKLFTEEYETINQKGETITRKRNVLLYWKLEDEIIARRKRDDKLDRAIKSLGNNAYAIKHTYEEYIKEIHLVNQTGEIANKVKKIIDHDKVDNDSLYDGYFCIITSELDYDYKKILEVYGGLWRIEESFRITKSDLELRPIYVSRESRINGHFLICYTALLIIRMLQLKLKFSLSVERIVRALKSSKCILEIDETVKILRNESVASYKEDTSILIDEDETLKDYLKIIDAYKSEIPFARYKTKAFNTFLESIKY